MSIIKTVSLIIPTLNRGEVLLDLLENINKLKSVRERKFVLDIIVVDQSDIKFIDRYKLTNDFIFSLKYVHITQKGLPNARNVAMTFARGEICIFIDDDVVLHENFIEEHIRSLKDNQIGAVAGKVIEDDFIKSVKSETPRTMYGINHFGKYYPLRGGNSVNYVLGFPGGNFSIRKSIYHEVGKFDLGFSGSAQLEETDYAYRIRKLGYKIIFNPNAVLTHLRIASGGCRVSTLSEKRFWRFHNSMLFFLKNKPRVFLPTMIFTLSAGGLSEVFKGKYSIKSYLWSLKGFYKGYKTFLTQNES